MKGKEFSWKKRAESFRFALSGLRFLLRQEHNAWIHAAATLSVFAGAWYFQLSRNEIMSVVMVTGFVWVGEIFNTAIERIMDFISPEKHEKVKHIKDLSAAAILIAAITAFITGLIIFIPKLF